MPSFVFLGLRSLVFLFGRLLAFGGRFVLALLVLLGVLFLVVLALVLVLFAAGLLGLLLLVALGFVLVLVSLGVFLIIVLLPPGELPLLVVLANAVLLAPLLQFLSVLDCVLVQLLLEVVLGFLGQFLPLLLDNLVPVLLVLELGEPLDAELHVGVGGLLGPGLLGFLGESHVNNNYKLVKYSQYFNISGGLIYL